MINETIVVDAGEGIAALDEFAAAAGRADAKFAALEGRLKGGLSAGGAGGGGADKLAASMEAAAAKVDAAAARIAATFDKIAAAGDRLASAGAGADKLAAGLGAAADETKGLAAGLDKVSASGKGAGDSLKGLGDTAKRNSAWMAEYNAEMKAADDLQRKYAATSAESARVIARSQSLQTAAARDAAVSAKAAQREQAAAAAAAAASAEKTQRRYETLALGGAAAVAYGIYKAAQLQTSVTRLYTSAGESKANLPAMTQGILRLSGQTATSQAELGQGAYMIESAGFHGPAALQVLRAAAQGAQAEGAPLGEVGNALTSLMVSYGMKPSQATAAMNQIITMVGSGKMTMASAVSALPQVLSAGAAAKLSFGQVGGALATMTAGGTSPDQAAQNLRHTIGSLAGPNAVQQAEMYQLGLDPVSLAKNLGKTGLTGTVAEIQAALAKHTGKGGLVQLDTMNASKAATADALTMLKAMPPALQELGKAYLDNGITQKQWIADLKGLPPLQANLLKQFATTTDLAHGFSAALKSGAPAAQTYSAALQKALGGTVGFQTFLMLSGQHLATFKANADGVSQAAKDAGMNVKGWADIQKTFNFQLHSFQYSAEAAATTLGTALLPAATSAMKVLAGAGNFLAQHPALTKDLALGGGGLAAIGLAGKVASPVMTGVRAVGKVAETLHIPGLDKLAHIGQGAGLDGAAAGLRGAAGSLSGAAADLSGAAARLAGEGAAGGAAGAARTAEGGAAAAGASRFKGAATTTALGVLGAATIVDPILKSMRNRQGNWLDNAFGTPSKSGWNNWQSFGHDLATLWGLIPGGHRGQAPNAGTPVYSAPSGAAFAKAGGAITMPAHAAAAPAPPPVKVPPVDTSALDMAKVKIQATLQTIGSGHAIKPIKVPAPDMSALDGAKAKAMSAGEGIQQAAQNAMKKPVKPAPPDLSSLASAAGKAAADGAAVSAGFASGIRAGMGAAVAAAQAVAAAAAAAMSVHLQIHSPSRVTHRYGEEFAAGFERGIKSKAHTAKAAAATLSASALQSLTENLQGGKSAIDAAAQAISGKGSRPQDIQTIQDTITKLDSQVASAMKKGTIPLGQGTALTAMLQADNQKLQLLAQKRATLEQEIQDSQQIAQSAVSSASIVTAGQGSYTPALATGPIAAAQTLQGMQMMAGDQSRFASVVKQLKAGGLNATSLDQIIQAGAQQGLPVALGLLQGGKGAIGQANMLEKSILKSASALGDVGGPAMYQAGQQLGQAAASGLKSELGAVDAAMKQIAQALVADVDRALHIKPPSHGGGHPAHRPAGHGGGTPVVHNHVTVHMTVQGSVSTEHDLVSHLQEHVLTRANSNWQTGWKLPGRAA